MATLWNGDDINAETAAAQDDAEHFARTVEEAWQRDDDSERIYLDEAERRSVAEAREVLGLDA